MKKILVFFMVCLWMAQPLAAQHKILRRENSFFGLHFDFHASANDTLMGKTLTEGMIDTLLVKVKPDFIQIDCKGHHGVTSYPTRVPTGTHVKSFDKNPLEIFRKVTQKRGVALYVHYSGVWDNAALAKQPHWAAINAKGEPDKQKTSVHSSYVDSLMIPQLKEIADYGVDGVWVDGDCWATVLDYSPKSLEKFTAETGITAIPRSKQEPYYEDFMNFARRSFKKYVGHYVESLHRYKPDFQVASNWAFSSFMPEPVDISVDFMSGDLAPMNGVNSALFEARVLAAQSKKYNKPWDLMSWSFNTNWGSGVHGAKTALNLCQEAAEVIACGGGYQCYFTQNRDASIRPHQVGVMSELAQFVRERQAFNQGAKAIPQIALLYSLGSYHKYSNSVYGNAYADAIKGILSALIDGQQAVEILSEHHLNGRMAEYPLIVIPEMPYLEASFQAELIQYVANGGNLMVIGADAVKNFTQPLGIELSGTPQKQTAWIGVGQSLAVINDAVQSVSLKTPSQLLHQIYNIEDLRFPAGAVASMASVGKGKIIGVYANIGNSYMKYQSPQLRDFINGLVRKLFPAPIVEVLGSKLVHLTVNEQKGNLRVNLINAGGVHANKEIYTYDELAPIQHLTLRIRTNKAPKSVLQQPENKKLKVKFQSGIATVHVPRIDIHSILEVNY